MLCSGNEAFVEGRKLVMGGCLCRLTAKIMAF